MTTVQLYAASSAVGLDERAGLTGENGLRPPDVSYTSVDGGLGRVALDPGSMTAEAVSSVFIGETLVEVPFVVR